jgi:hypothetical protein
MPSGSTPRAGLDALRLLPQEARFASFLSWSPTPERRSMMMQGEFYVKRLLLLGALLCMGAAPSIGSTYSHVHQPVPVSQGGYASCGVEWNTSTCFSNLDLYATGPGGRGTGFRYLANNIFFAACASSAGPPSSNCAGSKFSKMKTLPPYLRHAAADHMQIWGRLHYDSNGLSGSGFVHNYPDFSASCRPPATTNLQFLKCAVPIVKDEAGWAGWIPDDEPGAYVQEASINQAVCNEIAKLGDSHPCWIVQTPGSGNPPPQDEVDKNFGPYAWMTVIGSDYFPIGTPGEAIPQIGRVVSEVQRTLRHERSSARASFTVQAFAWCEVGGPLNECTIPTEAQLLAMRNQALEHAQPWAIFYYSFDIVLCETPTPPPGCDPKANWNALLSAAFSDMP